MGTMTDAPAVAMSRAVQDPGKLEARAKLLLAKLAERKQPVTRGHLTRAAEISWPDTLTALGREQVVARSLVIAGLVSPPKMEAPEEEADEPVREATTGLRGKKSEATARIRAAIREVLTAEPDADFARVVAALAARGVPVTSRTSLRTYHWPAVREEMGIQVAERAKGGLPKGHVTPGTRALRAWLGDLLREAPDVTVREAYDRARVEAACSLGMEAFKVHIAAVRKDLGIPYPKKPFAAASENGAAAHPHDPHEVSPESRDSGSGVRVDVPGYNDAHAVALARAGESDIWEPSGPMLALDAVAGHRGDAGLRAVREAVRADARASVTLEDVLLYEAEHGEADVVTPDWEVAAYAVAAPADGPAAPTLPMPVVEWSGWNGDVAWIETGSREPRTEVTDGPRADAVAPPVDAPAAPAGGADGPPVLTAAALVEAGKTAQGWTVWRGATEVECPECGFCMSANMLDMDHEGEVERYTCPLCTEIAITKALARAGFPNKGAIPDRLGALIADRDRLMQAAPVVAAEPARPSIEAYQRGDGTWSVRATGDIEFIFVVVAAIYGEQA